MTSGSTNATRQPVFFGMDRIDVPATPVAKNTQWMRLLFQKSTFRITGAYLQFQSARHWHDQLLPLRDDGWGTGAIYLGYSRESFVRQETDAKGVVVRHFDAPEKKKWRELMTGATGKDHAVATRTLAQSAHMLPGQIIWFDNEDSSDVVFEQHELDYYAEYFKEIGWTGTERAAFRPGLYAHQAIAAQLLQIRPDLCLWEVDYGNNVNRSVLPQLRTPTGGDSRFGFDPSSSEWLLKSFNVVPADSQPPWVAWPLWRQCEGNNQGKIPPSALGKLTPLVNWDFNSSLVRDPSDSVATPRLKVFSLGSTAYVARLDDLDPQYNATTGARELPRRGQLRLYPSPSFRTTVEITSDSNWTPGPASPILAYTQNTAELVMVSTLSEFGSSTLVKNAWSPATSLWRESIAPEVRFPYAFDGCQTGSERHLFYATTSGQIYASRRKNDDPWGARKPVGGKLLIHPFAMLAACTRQDTVHVLSFDQQSHLVAAQWQTSDKQWPANTFATVTNDPLLPGSIALASPSPTELVAVVVGTDLRPRRYVYRVNNQGGSWSTGVVIGDGKTTVMANARLALAVVGAQAIDCVATGSDGNPQRYTLTSDAEWGASASAPLLNRASGNAAPPLFTVNPHGDISTTVSPISSTPLAAFCGIGNGTAEALLSLSNGTAIRLMA